MIDDRTIRLEPIHAVREELYEPESEGLRARILAAHESGDVDLLRQLQAEFRSRHFPARTRATVVEVEPEEIVRTVPRPDRSREVMGYVATYHSPGRNRGEDVMGRRAVVSVFERGCFDAWLASVDFADESMPHVLLFHHDGGVHGRMVAADADETGLRGLFEIDDTPAGRLLLLGCDAGEVGFSVRAVPIAWAVRGEWHGWPLVAITQAGINETSLTTEPMDPHAIILTVGGERATYLRIQDARNRSRQLRQVWNRR